MATFVLLSITLFLSLMYIEALIGDSVNESNKYALFRLFCAIVLPILWSLFFYLIHIP